MTRFDSKLADALNEEDEAFLKDLEHGEGLFEQMGATLTGPLKYWTVMVFVMTFVFFGLAVFSVIRILATESMNEAVVWNAVFVFSAIAVAMLKMWVWMRMNHLAVLRELKRIELQLVKDAG